MVLADTEPHDFEWLTTDEPHAGRRKEMLTKEYAPKLRSLMGSDWTLTYWVASLFAVQMTVAWLMRSADFSRLLIVAYCIGGTCNHSLALSMHELSHNTAFGFLHCTANRWLAWFANLSLGIPAASTFKKYHPDHHRYMGNSEIDADAPSDIEGRLFRTTLGKVIWLIIQPFFYAFRPFIFFPKAPTRHEVCNYIIQLSFDALLVYYFSWKSVAYLVIGTILGLSLHPISGHFISEHFMLVKGIETASYYGPLNFLTYNVGYHTEHHDFPNVPGRYLPEVTKTAPEFYENLHSYRSWTKVLFDFATDPTVGVYSKVKRLPKDKVLSNSAAAMPKLSAKQTKARCINDDLVNDDGENPFLDSSKED